MKKKIGLALTLATLSSGVLAEWVALDESQNSVVYVDRITVRRMGNTVKMWHMYDFSEGQQLAGVSYLSSKAQTEYNCKSEQRRTIFDAAFSENMGNGSQVHAYNNPKSEWEPVMPGTMGESLWNFACGKPKPK